MRIENSSTKESFNSSNHHSLLDTRLNLLKSYFNGLSSIKGGAARFEAIVKFALHCVTLSFFLSQQKKEPQNNEISKEVSKVYQAVVDDLKAENLRAPVENIIKSMPPAPAKQLKTLNERDASTEQIPSQAVLDKRAILSEEHLNAGNIDPVTQTFINGLGKNVVEVHNDGLCGQHAIGLCLGKFCHQMPLGSDSRNRPDYIVSREHCSEIKELAASIALSLDVDNNSVSSIQHMPRSAGDTSAWLDNSQIQYYAAALEQPILALSPQIESEWGTIPGRVSLCLPDRTELTVAIPEFLNYCLFIDKKWPLDNVMDVETLNVCVGISDFLRQPDTSHWQPNQTTPVIILHNGTNHWRAIV
ncbi:MAG: hypothetical protein A2Y14_05145 [Verrucomicrobia bacterium GWF2_51_19]|nr:MAG: hypothetical protein A2Y14_05145 [Verrucomicrobia bacterium GWF2_51_19]HCJ12482.1 hypothetical protein [Opitutae bacterium]